ncbi:MAG: hypothetical protein HC911_03695 [Chloroflexaceae bacterium]|nr:hypothetical protein [Chloroflexaceae bacterium]
MATRPDSVQQADCADPADPVASFDLPTAILRTTQQAFAGLADAVPLVLAPQWAMHQGTLRGQPVTIATDVWQTTVLGWARVALLQAGPRTSVVSVLLFPRLAYDLPLCGAEVVSINGRINLAVMDWVPMSASRATPPALAAIRAQFAHYPNDPELPDWVAASFSPHLLYLRPKPRIAPADLHAAYTAYLHGYLQLCATATPHGDPAQTFAAQQHFSLDDMAKTPGGAMLARLFGAEWAAAYSHAVLFRPGGAYTTPPT